MIEDKSMKLYIDTSSNQQTIVQLGDKKLVRDSSVWKSQAVLPMLKELLGERDIKEITEIKINPGPGSYTGLKVGAAIANALSFALGLDAKHLIVYD